MALGGLVSSAIINIKSRESEVIKLNSNDHFYAGSSSDMSNINFNPSLEFNASVLDM
jgi:hypothetical protein